MKYIINESRLVDLILEIIKNLEITGLYRVQININLDGKTQIIVALFMETLATNTPYKKTEESVQNTIESFLGFKTLVIVIPYSDEKHHLREPRNI